MSETDVQEIKDIIDNVDFNTQSLWDALKAIETIVCECDAEDE